MYITKFLGERLYILRIELDQREAATYWPHVTTRYKVGAIDRVTPYRQKTTKGKFAISEKKFSKIFTIFFSKGANFYFDLYRGADLHDLIHGVYLCATYFGGVVTNL